MQMKWLVVDVDTKAARDQPRWAVVRESTVESDKARKARRVAQKRNVLRHMVLDEHIFHWDTDRHVVDSIDVCKSAAMHCII